MTTEHSYNQPKRERLFYIYGPNSVCLVYPNNTSRGETKLITMRRKFLTAEAEAVFSFESIAS